VLSIRQPWAWLICHAGKDIENRTWKTNFRGHFLVHASKGLTRTEYDDACEWVSMDVGSIAIPAYEDLERGGIIGRAVMTDCLRYYPSPWFQGPFGFVIDNPKPLPFFPCKGALGFFRLPNA